MSNYRNISKDTDRLESTNSSDAIYVNSDTYSRNKSSFNNIQNILNMYTQEIQAEKNREASGNSFKRSDNLLRGQEAISDDIYINSLANLSDAINSEMEQNIKTEIQQDENNKLLEEDIHYKDHIYNTLHNNEIIKDSQDIDSSLLNYSNENESQQHVSYKTYNSDNNSNAYSLNHMNEYESKHNENYQKEHYIYDNNSNSELDYIYNKSLNDNIHIQTINQDTNSEYNMHPSGITKNFLSKDFINLANNNKHNKLNHATNNSGNNNIINIDSELQFNYSTATYESSNKNDFNSSNGAYNTIIKNLNSYEKKSKNNYQSMIDFMRHRSIDSSIKNGSDVNSTNNNQIIDKNSFEKKTALSIKHALEKNSKCDKNEKNLERNLSDTYALNNTNKENIVTKTKSYSLEDMRNGKIEIPKTIFMPLKYNIPGNNIIDSYERSKKLEKFMNDCNNSTNLILKYPQAEKKKQPIKKINIPVHMSSTINNNIGLAIIYEDDFDRDTHFPNVTNLHVGSIFERHVFNMLKNKKDLGKQIYSANDKFQKYKYDKENGFWISNISKDRIKNPEKNNSYITELVYEKNNYNEEIQMLKECTNYNDIVPSVHNLYKDNNFYKFLYNQNLCPRYLNPDMTTIMRRYDVEKISSHKKIFEIPGIIPYKN